MQRNRIIQRRTLAAAAAIGIVVHFAFALSVKGQEASEEDRSIGRSAGATETHDPGPSVAPPDSAGRMPVAARNPGDPIDGMIPLNRTGTVLLDKRGRRVVVKARVVLRQGLLEMLLCKRQTKEHESILAVDADAYAIHAGLVAIGAEPGSVVRYDPQFQPPSGPKIDIFLQWRDKNGMTRRVPAQQWIRYAINRFYVASLDRLPPDVKIPDESELHYDAKFKELTWYGPMTAEQREELLALSQDRAYREAIRRFYRDSQPREMDMQWVFAGSRFRVDAETGRRFYLAEGGDLICVANFPDAMIDVAAESSQSNASLLFEAYTERIPPLDTPVLVELIPSDKRPADSKQP